MTDKSEKNLTNQYLGEYNELISKAALEHKGKFAVLASPTFNKQESITNLYGNVISHIDTNNKVVKKENQLLIRLKFFSRLCFLFYKLSRVSSRFRVRSLTKNSIYVRTWLVDRSIKNGNVKDVYFGKLISALSRNHDLVVGFQPLEYGKILNRFYAAKKPNYFINPIGLLNIFDIIGLIFDYIHSANIKLVGEYRFNKYDICHLINKSLNCDYYKLRSFQAYLELHIAKRLINYNPETIIYIFERQAWENAYLSVFKDSKTNTIGYQSSGFSFRFLNFFPSKYDAKYALFPNKILTVGDSFTKALKEFGHYPVPIKTSSALRFDYKVKNSRYIVEKTVPEIFKRLIYAFSVHLYQYPIIIRDLIDVFGDSKVEVHLKFHPLYKAKTIEVELPTNFKIWTGNSCKKLNRIYDAVLFNDNSYGIESLLQGVKSYEYNLNEVYDDTRLIDFNIYQHRIDKEMMNKLKQEIISNDYDKYFSQSIVSEYINNLYNYDTRFENLFSEDSKIN